jgi:hypothetical protein
VRVSTELVTSSMIRMAGRTRKARSCSRYRGLSIGGCSSSGYQLPLLMLTFAPSSSSTVS